MIRIEVTGGGGFDLDAIERDVMQQLAEQYAAELRLVVEAVSTDSQPSIERQTVMKVRVRDFGSLR